MARAAGERRGFGPARQGGVRPDDPDAAGPRASAPRAPFERGHRGDRRRHRAGGPQGALRRARRDRLRLLDPPRGAVPRQRLPPAWVGEHGAAEAAVRRSFVRGDRAARRGPQDRRRAPRADPRDGPHGIGQDHHPGGHDRLHQPDEARAHRDGRGPDRGAAPRRRGLDQPARGRQRYPGLPGGPPCRDAPGSRRDPDRRDAGHRDGARRASPRPRPATWSCPRSIPSTPPRP